MPDLEQQIVAWVDAETEGVDPVTPAEAWERTGPSVAGPRRGPSRGAFAVAVAAAILLLGGLALVYSARDHGPESVLSGSTSTTTPGWVRVPDVLPIGRWSVEKPASWTDQTWSLDCRPDSGYLVTNRPTELEPGGTGSGTGGCGVRWSEEDLSDPGFVGLELHLGDDPVIDVPPTGAADTPLPIDLDDGRTVWLRADGPSGQAWTTVVSRHGDHALRVRAWAAAEAPAADVAALRRIVRSLAWSPPDDAPDPADGEPTSRGGEVTQASGSSRMATFIACMADAGYHPYLADPPQEMVDGEVGAVLTWPAGEQERTAYGADHARCNEAAGASQTRRSSSQAVWPDRAGPSQTAGEAERDGVIPELAARTLAARAAPGKWFDTAEGTWAITTVPAEPDGTDCTIGDPEGTFGTEQVCSHDYGEVVLVDGAGRLLRAYPMPGAVPTWIYPTKDAIFAGRVGDATAPESTIARIDRRTLEAEVLVFPPKGGSLGVDLDGWSVAPSSADVTRLVVVGDDSAGPLVNSTTGITSVDLPAVEELFA